MSALAWVIQDQYGEGEAEVIFAADDPPGGPDPMTDNDRRIFETYEHAREMDETGERPGEVECEECSAPYNAEDGGVILLGVAICADCALPAACRERLAEDWDERPVKDRLDILDVLGTSANAEESSTRRALRPSVHPIFAGTLKAFGGSHGR